MYFTQESVHPTAALRFQARYSQLAWEELAKIQKGNDDYLKAQAMLSISSCCIVFPDIDSYKAIIVCFLHDKCKL